MNWETGRSSNSFHNVFCWSHETDLTSKNSSLHLLLCFVVGGRVGWDILFLLLESLLYNYTMEQGYSL